MHSALLGGSEQTALMSRAWAGGLADGRLVFLPYDTLLFALPFRNRSYPALGDGGALREAYDAVLTVSLESGEADKAFEAAGAGGGAARLDPEQVGQRGPSWGPGCGAVGRCARAPHPGGAFPGCMTVCACLSLIGVCACECVCLSRGLIM